jgi:hypothetical protein
MKKIFILLIVALLVVSGGIATAAITKGTPNKRMTQHPIIQFLLGRISTLIVMNGGHGGCHNHTNYTNVTGVLVNVNGSFSIGTTSLNLGGRCYLNRTALYDFDGDGTIETNYNEVLGLVGMTVTMGGYITGCHHGQLMVNKINGHLYRSLRCC